MSDTPQAPTPVRARSKYVIVRDYLLGLIRDELNPGDLVPSERELCERFSISRMTVRQAVDTLVADGVLERRQGLGTFVAPPKMDLQLRLTSFREEMRRRGMTPGAVVLTAETIEPSLRVSEALELEAGAKVHHLRRLLTADASPMAIEENWIPAHLLPDLLELPRSFSIYNELDKRGLTAQWGEDLIEGHTVTAEEANLLGVPQWAPALDITRRTFHQHIAVNYSRSLYRADRYTLWVPVAAPAKRLPLGAARSQA